MTGLGRLLSAAWQATVGTLELVAMGTQWAKWMGIAVLALVVVVIIRQMRR